MDTKDTEDCLKELDSIFIPFINVKVQMTEGYNGDHQLGLCFTKSVGVQSTLIGQMVK